MLERTSAAAAAGSLIEQIRNRIGKGSAPAPKAAEVVYRVNTASQGREAFDLVKASFGSHEPFAVMFLDMRMPPGWDGLETAQRIRAIDKELQIVIMTAYADYEQAEIAERIGEPDKLLYIKKPFHPEEIRQLALALSEKWNLSRREKGQLVLTSRLLHESATLTRQRFLRLDQAYRGILNAFVAFLDARAGVLVRFQGATPEVCAATSPPDAAAILPRLPAGLLAGARAVTNDEDGACYLPICFEGFTGFVCLHGKSLSYGFDQLRPFLDILMETGREVLINAYLLQGLRDERLLGTMSGVTRRLADRLDAITAPLQGHAEALRQELAPAARQAAMQQATAAAEQVHDLAGHIRNYSLLLRREVQLTPQPLAPLVRQALTDVKPRLDAGRVVVSSELDETLAPPLDAEAFYQALTNLLVNASEALAARPAGAARQLAVTLRRAEGREAGAVLTLRDTGGGLPPAVADCFFEPFSSHGKANAPGLGAAAARHIIERHHGQVSHRSEPGVGTTIVIELPAPPTGS